LNWRPRSRTLLSVLVVLSGFVTLTACAVRSGRTLQPTATQPIPDDLATYMMLTEKYTAHYVIFSIDDMPLDEAARIIRALRSIDPPAGLEELHRQAISAYEYVTAGKLLVPGADSQLRAEAYFQIDWGIQLLIDYREQLEDIAQPTGRSGQ